MRQPHPRPFTLGDLMVLVAAIAAGFGLQRWVEAPVERTPRFLGGGFGIYAEDAFEIAFMLPVSNWFDYLWLRQSSYIEFAITAALVALRWRGPRPRARVILRQPGAVACLAVVVAVCVGFLTKRVMLGLRPDELNSLPEFLSGRGMAWNWAVRWASAAVAGVWASLAFRGRWRPERSWIDFAGRLVGWYWLLGVILAEVFWPALDVYLSYSQDHHR